MERYLELFFENYNNFREDILATFPEYESVIPVVPETENDKLTLVASIVQQWQTPAVKQKIAREDETAFQDPSDDNKCMMGTIPIAEILAKCNDENKKVVWKYVKSLLVFGSAVANPVNVQISDDVKQKLVDSVEDKIIDDDEIRQARKKTNHDLFKYSADDSPEMKFMKKIFKTLANSVTAQLKGKNKKHLMKQMLSGKHNEILDIKKLEKELQPLIAEMEKKIQEGKLNEDKFKQEALAMIDGLQSQGGDQAGIGSLLSQMGFKGGLSELLPKYEKFKAEDHYLPEMPDLPPVAAAADPKPSNKKQKRKK